MGSSRQLTLLMKTICIIQARLGSQRLPGKMLMKIGELSIIEWVILRVKKSLKIDEIFMATTTNEQDNILAEIALSNDIFVFKGSEKNVLSRFVEINKISNADNIVRVCADNPFVSADEIDKLINYFLQNDCDYACNHKEVLGNRCVDGFGAEIFSKKTLFELSTKSNKPEHFEHVTSYVWENQEDFNISALTPEKNMAYPELRFDVDTEEDLKKLNSFINLFPITIDSKADKIVEKMIKYKMS